MYSITYGFKRTQKSKLALQSSANIAAHAPHPLCLRSCRRLKTIRVRTMNSVADGARKAYHFIATCYTLLWSCFTGVTVGTYSGLRLLSGVYSPAKHFLLSTERAIALLRTNAAKPLEVQLHLVLEAFWSQKTVLETLVGLCKHVPYAPHALLGYVRVW